MLCFNEAGTIEKVTRLALDVAREISDGNYEVIVVDDGSSDGSKEIIQKLAAEDPHVVPVIHPQNMGIGEGLRSGYFHARYENVVCTSGDGQFDINELKTRPYLLDGEFISFYRLENTTYSSYRVLLSWINKKLNLYLLGLALNDVNWTKVYKREELLKLDLQLHSSLVESEICSKFFAKGYKVIQIQSKILPRTYGESKGSSWKILRKAISDIIRLYGIIRNFKKELRKQK